LRSFIKFINQKSVFLVPCLLQARIFNFSKILYIKAIVSGRGKKSLKLSIIMLITIINLTAMCSAPFHCPHNVFYRVLAFCAFFSVINPTLKKDLFSSFSKIFQKSEIMTMSIKTTIGKGKSISIKLKGTFNNE